MLHAAPLLDAPLLVLRNGPLAYIKQVEGNNLLHRMRIFKFVNSGRQEKDLMEDLKK